MQIADFIKPELLVLVPVLYIIGMGLKKSRLDDRWIPLVLGGAGILLAFAWVLGTASLSAARDFFLGGFTAVVQGILCAGASVYVNQLGKQLGSKGK